MKRLYEFKKAYIYAVYLDQHITYEGEMFWRVDIETSTSSASLPFDSLSDAKHCFMQKVKELVIGG